MANSKAMSSSKARATSKADFAVTFHYVAIDRNGREIIGQIAAPDIATARRTIEARGDYLLALSETSDPASDASHPFRSLHADKHRADEHRADKPSASSQPPPRMSRKNLALFTRQLAVLSAAVPLEEALRLLSHQSEEQRVRLVISRLHAGLTAGLPLAEAMAQAPLAFPATYRAMISVGEASGSLPAILERLAAHLEQQIALRSKLLAALAYPTILAMVAVGVVVALMIFVVPRIAEQFDDVGQQLPLLTRAVIATSDFAVHWWWALGLCVALLTIAALVALRTPILRYRVDRALLRLPLVGRLLRNAHAAALARILATMVASQLPLVEGVRLCIPTIGNRAMAAAVETIAEQIRAGASLASGLRGAGLFPPLLVYLAASGESAGQLDIMLERAADYMEQDTERFITSAMALLEPCIIIAMGLFVALVILSILLPILQLQNLAGL